MDSTFIKETLGYVDLDILGVEKVGDTIQVQCCSSLSTAVNAELQAGIKVIDRRKREIREMSIFKYKVILHVTVRKFVTKGGEYFWEELSFARKGSHYSKQYESYLFERCQGSDLKRVALQEQIGIDSLSGIYHYYAEKNSRP